MTAPHEREQTGPLCDGKVVLVTGAGRGIGRPVAALAAIHGARLAIVEAGFDLGRGGPLPVVG
ncbi:MAG: hypothetical protein ACK6CU_15130, partial [Deltaproteobacteria bacterium]